MAVRTPSAAANGLGIRSRLALFNNSSLDIDRACTLDDGEIKLDLLLAHGVKPVNLLVAGVGPMRLKERGVDEAMQLRQLGFDALHLCDASFCNEASMAFGSSAIRAAFLVSATDAVAIAGSEAVHILGVTTEMLLDACAGYPAEAAAVMQQLPHGVSLDGVVCNTVLNAGLRADALKASGYGLGAVVAQLAPTGRELSKLGYTC